MTRLYVDDREIQFPLDVSSLNQIVDHVENVHLAANTVIRQIRVDGLPLNDGNPEFLSGIDQRNKVEIFTGTLAEIANESVKDATAYLDRVEAAIPSIVTSFQANPGPASFESLKQLCEGLYWLNLLFSKLKDNFQISLDEVRVQNVSAAEHNQKFIAVLKQLIESQQNNDSVLISDLLEYEVLPLVPVWREMLAFSARSLCSAQ